MSSLEQSHNHDHTAAETGAGGYNKEVGRGEAAAGYQPAKAQNGTGGLQGGTAMTQTVTPGGHTVNDDLLAVGMAPRKIASPLPLATMSFATTTLLLSL